MLSVLLRTFLFYGLLMAVLRLLGKRQIGEMEPAEFVVTMLLANLATIPIENPDVPVTHGLLPIAFVVGGELLLAYLTLRSIKIRKLLCGKPVILIEEGKISQENLRRTRINLDELTMHLREKNVFDLSQVKFAILETNGELSTLLYAKECPASAKEAGISVKEVELPITILSDGRLLRENLQAANKDISWVEAELKRRNCTQKEVLLLTVDRCNRVFFVRKQDIKTRSARHP